MFCLKYVKIQYQVTSTCNSSIYKLRVFNSVFPIEFVSRIAAVIESGIQLYYAALENVLVGLRRALVGTEGPVSVELTTLRSVAHWLIGKIIMAKYSGQGPTEVILKCNEG